MKYCLSVYLLLLSFGAHAALNKWVDADGKVHYSDQPPPSNVKARTLVTSGPASGVEPAKSLTEREAEWEKAQKEQASSAQKAAREQETAMLKQRNCMSARNTLQNLQDSPRIVTFDANGAQSFMDDAERQRNMEQARKAVSQFCD